jgi:O-antigen ligase
MDGISAGPHGFILASTAVSRAAFYFALLTLTFEQTRPYEVSIYDICFMVAIVFALPLLLTLRLPLPSRTSIIPGGFLILAGGAFSLLNADLSDPDLVSSAVKMLVTFGALPLLVALHGRHVKTAALFFAMGVALNCGVAVLEAAGIGLREMLEINPVNEADFWGRYRGLASHANLLGVSAALASMVLVSAFIAERQLWRRAILGGALLLCGVAAGLTGSRTALLALPLMGLLLVTQGAVRPVQLALAATILALSAGGVTLVLPEYAEQMIDRVLATGVETEGDYFRMESLQIAAAEIAEHPLVGWGVDKAGMAGYMYVRQAQKFLGTHNSPVQFWYAFGILGTAGWVLMFVNTLRRLWGARRQGDATARTFLDPYLGMVILLLIAGNLHPFIFVRLFYVPLYLAAAAAAWTLHGQGSTAQGRAAPAAAVRPAHA